MESEAPSVSKLCTWIFKSILSCEKQISLYPRSHPRVAKGLRNIRRFLSQYFERANRPFVIDVDQDDLVEEDLSRLLQVHLIEKLILRPGVTDEELFQLCLLLHEDLSSTPQVSEESGFDPEGWAHIQVYFYSYRDTSVTVGEAGEGGLEQRGVLHDLLEELPETDRESVRATLRDPILQRKLSDLRRSVSAHLSGGGERELEKIDVVTEVFRELLAQMASSDSARFDRENIFLALDNLTSFANYNLDLLSRELKSYENKRTDTDDVQQQIAQTLAHGPDVSQNVRYLQLAKKKLANLFRTSSESGRRAPDPEPEKPASSEKAPPKRSPPAAREAAGDKAVEERFRSISYDAEELRRGFLDDTERKQYLQINLELLSQEEYREELKEHWYKIKASLLQHGDHQEYREYVLAELASFVASEELPELKEVLVALVAKTELTNSTLAWLEALAAEPEGAVAVGKLLDLLVEKDRDGAVKFLARLHSKGTGALRESSRDRLVALSKYPALVSMWAAEDPESLMASDVLRALHARVGLGGVQRAFETYFRHANFGQATELLGKIEARLPGAERIVFAAIENGAAPVREQAIVQLRKFSSSIALKILKEIIKLNNYISHPHMQEVKAALLALATIKSPAARSFLKEIANKRRWMRYEYRKEIRKALMKIVKKSD